MCGVTSQKTPSTLADWIDQRRADLGLDTVQLAAKMGTSRQWLIDLRNGKITRPRATTRRAIERALDWEQGSVAEILAGGEPTPLPEPEDIATMSMDDLTEAFTELAKDLSDEELLAVMTKALAIRRQAREREAG